MWQIKVQQGKEPARLLEGLVAIAGITVCNLAVSGVLRIMISVGFSAPFYLLHISYCYVRHYIFWPI